MVSTIVKPLSALNVLPTVDRPPLCECVLILSDLLRSGLALDVASGPGGRQSVSPQCQWLRCIPVLLLEWLTMMAALRNYSA